MVHRLVRIVSRGIGDLLPNELRRKAVDLKSLRPRIRLEAGFAKLRSEGKTIVQFLHIGKTGGTAVKAALRDSLDNAKYYIALRGHGIRLQDVPAGDKVFFFLRDPVTRFESGFYSRQNQGAPRYDEPWGPFEYRAFSRFKSANDLAEALSSPSDVTRHRAESAMKSIRHVCSSFWDWFGDADYLESRKDDVVFYGFQETLPKDFERLKCVLGLPSDLGLPKNEVTAYRAPRTERTPLSEKSIENIKNWYETDYNFIKICKERFES